MKRQKQIKNTRNTIQKSAIKKVLSTADQPLTVEVIRDAASVFVGSLGMATVYRVLKSLQASKEVSRVPVGESIYYELTNGHHHHHFHCRECKEVLDVKGCAGNLGNLLPSGYSLEGHELILYGVCAKCR